MVKKMIKRKTKIIIVHWQADVIGGAEIALLDLIRLVSEKYEVLNLFHSEGNVPEYYRVNGYNVLVRSINTKRRLYPGLHTLQSFLLFLYLKRSKFEFIICNTLPAVSRVRTASLLSGIPIVSFVRDHFSHSQQNLILLRQTQKIIAVSGSIREHILNQDRNLSPFLLNDFINAEHFTLGKNVVTDHFEFAVIGRIQSLKQVEVIMQAFLQLAKSENKLKLKIYGEPGPNDKEYYRSLINLKVEFDLQNLIVFEGFRSDISNILQSSSALIVSSKHEAFPRVILEAQLCKIPVIASNVGGIPEQIIHEFTGLLFNVNVDTEEEKISNLLLQMKELLCNTDLRNRIVNNAHINCTNEYANASKFYNDFNSILFPE
jgi:glycosyltransferase involved in cell wall biosynthesis